MGEGGRDGEVLEEEENLTEDVDIELVLEMLGADVEKAPKALEEMNKLRHVKHEECRGSDEMMAAGRKDGNAIDPNGLLGFSTSSCRCLLLIHLLVIIFIVIIHLHHSTPSP